MPASTHLSPISPATHHWRRRWLGWRGYWLAQIAGWGGFLLLATQSLLTPGPLNQRVLLENVEVAFLGLLTTHVLRVLLLGIRGRELTWRQLGLRLAPCWLAGSVALGGAISFVSVHLYAPELADGTLVHGDGLTEYMDMVTRSLFFIGIWLSLYFAYQYYHQTRVASERQLRLLAQVREAELRALKAQLNPHFLFNSLNAIRAMIPRDLPRPRQAVTSLSELLRAALRLGERPLVTLADELAIVEHYLALETMRHESRLRSSLRIDPDTLAWPVPPFVLQTLVENAVNHGIAQSAEGGEVTLVTRLLGTRLEVTVVNPGPLRTTSRSTGLGLQNVRTQLAHLYGPEARLELAEAHDYVVARLLLPHPREPELPPHENSPDR